MRDNFAENPCKNLKVCMYPRNGGSQNRDLNRLSNTHI